MIENVLQSFIIHAAGHDLLDLNGRGMERGVDAEHDPLVAHGLIGVGDLAAHGRAGGLQPDIFVSPGHGDGCVHIDAVGMAHMDHYHGKLRVALR